MATYEEIAPELSVYVTENAAVNFAEDFINTPTVTYKTLSDLQASERSLLFEWLKWFGRNRKPNNLNPSSYFSVKRIMTMFSMSREYVLSLIEERNSIIGEVAQWGDDAFIPHIAAIIEDVVIYDGYNYDGYDGYMIITGTTMLSLGSQQTVVTVTRPGVAVVNRTKTQIQNAGGYVTDTEILIIDGTYPAALIPNDEVTITANGFTSEVFIIA